MLEEVALTGLFVDYIDKKIRKMIYEVGRGVTQRVWEKLEGGGDARDQNTLYTHMKPSENRELKQVFLKNHRVYCIIIKERGEKTGTGETKWSISKSQHFREPEFLVTVL